MSQLVRHLTPTWKGIIQSKKITASSLFVTPGFPGFGEWAGMGSVQNPSPSFEKRHRPMHICYFSSHMPCLRSLLSDASSQTPSSGFLFSDPSRFVRCFLTDASSLMCRPGWLSLPRRMPFPISVLIDASGELTENV